MANAQVLTAWVGDSSENNPYHPRLADDYLIQFEDVTGQLNQAIVPDPNLFAIAVVADEATLAQIANDPRYEILWQD